DGIPARRARAPHSPGPAPGLERLDVGVEVCVEDGDRAPGGSVPEGDTLHEPGTERHPSAARPTRRSPSLDDWDLRVGRGRSLLVAAPAYGLVEPALDAAR